MEALQPYLVAGIVSGSLYSLIAIGLNLLVMVMGVIQFAYGEVVVFSIYVCWIILQLTGNLFLAFLGGAATSLMLTILVEPLLRGLRERGLFVETMVMTIAVGLILTEIMSHFLNAGLPIAFPSSIVGGGWDVSFGLLLIRAADLFIVISTVVLLGGLVLFLFKTKQGKALRAIAFNIPVAKVLGIPLRRATILSFGLAGLLSGMTAMLFIISVGVASPGLGGHLTFIGLAVVLLGGLGSLKGAVLGGFLLGIIECLVRGYFWGDWVDAIAMGFIMVVIILRPNGLMGTANGLMKH